MICQIGLVLPSLWTVVWSVLSQKIDIDIPSLHSSQYYFQIAVDQKCQETNHSNSLVILAMSAKMDVIIVYFKHDVFQKWQLTAFHKP